MDTQTEPTWTHDDEVIAYLRRRMFEAEERLLSLRDQLNGAIVTRRATLPDDAVICPVCGRVLHLQIGRIEPHLSDRPGQQCRGTGLTPAVIAASPMTGGL